MDDIIASQNPHDRSGPATTSGGVGELLLQALVDAGVKEIFGIPGDFILSFFKVIEESQILPLYVLSHEPSVGFVADGAARTCCRPSAAIVTYGAGALNMVNPVAAAYAEKSPVVVISGGPGAMVCVLQRGASFSELSRALLSVEENFN